MPAAGSNGLVFMSLFLSGSGGKRLGLIVVLDYIGEGVAAFIHTCAFREKKVWTNFAGIPPLGPGLLDRGSFVTRNARTGGISSAGVAAGQDQRLDGAIYGQELTPERGECASSGKLLSGVMKAKESEDQYWASREPASPRSGA